MAQKSIPIRILKQLHTIEFKIDLKSAAQEIEKHINQTTLVGGKRLRPLLSLMLADLFEIPFSDICTYARASEYVHSATLAHDDVIDESKLRRDRPTLNSVIGNTKAVLSGDLLLARVMAELAALANIPIIQDLTQVIEDLVAGEWLQLEARGLIDIDRRHLEKVAQLKTGSLMSWCCSSVARIAKLQPEQIELCRNFGMNLGLAFQMVDDVVDFSDDGGKEYSKDFKEGLMNQVTVHFLEKNPQLHSTFKKSFGKGEVFPWNQKQMQASLAFVRQEAKMKLHIALTQLQEIGNIARSRNLDRKSEIDEVLAGFKSITQEIEERTR